MKNKVTSRFIFVIACIVLAGVMLVVAGVWYRSQTQKSSSDTMEPPDSTTILVTENGFIPEDLTVSVGMTVKFKNVDKYWHWPASDPHPSHVFYSELDPKKPVGPGETWEVTLQTAGEWGIHDHLAPYILGKVIVIP